MRTVTEINKEVTQEQFNKNMNDWAGGWIGQFILIALAVSFPWVSIPLITIYFLATNQKFRRLVGWLLLASVIAIGAIALGVPAYERHLKAQRAEQAASVKPWTPPAKDWDPTEFKRADERPPVAVWDPAKDGFKCVANC